MREPGPDHPLSITPSGRRVRVSVAGHIVADSVHSLAMKEADYPVVYYLPQDEVDLSVLTPTDHRTHCPYKGDASYLSIAVDGDVRANAVWRYEAPYPAVEPIRDHVAFYPAKVDAITVSDP